jgi:hypothetical protein
VRGEGYGVRIRKTKSTRPGRVTRHETHAPARSSIRSRASGDGHRRRTLIEEGPFDRDGAAFEEVDPPALPAHAHLNPNALALIRPHHVLVPGVEQLVVEREQITGRIAVRGEIDDGVGGRVLDHG